MDSPAAKPPAPLLIHGLTRDELARVCREAGAQPYRARQVWDWLYRKRVSEWDAMTNLPPALRAALSGRCLLRPAEALRVEGRPGHTRKILAGLADGEQVEEVLIPAARRRTVCVSSQVGCRFRCAFCASGQAGFRRNLEAGEMVGQALLAARLLEAAPTHVVFMGVGEPLDNYDAVLRAVRILNDADGLAVGARRITISTCGLVPGIARLAGEGLQVELSVSLHAPTDALRAELMPVNRRYPLAVLLEACRDYTARTGRIVTFEYTLIRGCNDAREHARALAALLKGLACRVNLIPLSPVAEFGYAASDAAAARLFTETLSRAGINATLRISRGASLDAACGQLRARSRSQPLPGGPRR